MNKDPHWMHKPAEIGFFLNSITHLCEITTDFDRTIKINKHVFENRSKLS